MQDSNLHALRPRLLKPLRLPVPPIGLLFGVRGRDRTDDHRVHIPERCHCATRTIELNGLRGEVRTPDPMLPKHVRCQLRYAEMNCW